MNYQTFLPAPILQPFISLFALQETGEADTYRVLPDTGLVIGFQYKGQLSSIQQEREVSLSISGVSGLTDRKRVFKNAPSTGSVLVYFKEAGAAPFFRQPLHELFRESVSLDNFMLRSELCCLEQQLAEARSDLQRIATVEQFLIKRMNTTPTDPLVLAALALIHKSKGDIRISELLVQLHTSQSPLEKRFRQAVGTSPKKFTAIVRMKNLLQAYDPANSLTQLGYEAGFYDQAHFIKEFKNFTGDTPERFFSKED
ncbi:MAG: helix-turn-helix domain-containing protein [Saprospiraceae bacterium]|nr:helix-turn-helix domain-containing protein [Saprospiraceae bacterium]MCF8252770.1 helix-turn-helix domain-containing protein [Saprospiraceae bacterium]MCF8283142.1 helix-turn-helix domain-containing protein [Bacteroidales bacterium]MCF8314320.1 helix-turn-helix domain-containing protein [Saprospiraceae bacterium]MCF8443197.1 helix-turn-helix domain-containing protein [Saprospiraceae bacterium]